MDSQIVAQLRQLFSSGHPDFIPACLGIMDLHSRKNADYAGGEDPLGNFKRVGRAVGIPAWIVAFLYMMKQVDAVAHSIASGHPLNEESAEDKLRDISVYGILVYLLRKEELCAS